MYQVFKLNTCVNCKFLTMEVIHDVLSANRILYIVIKDIPKHVY